MTISEKLESIKASKEAIKQAIEAKGVACGDVLSEYPEKIAAIPTGGIDMTLVYSFSNWKFTTEQFEALNTYNWDKITNMREMFNTCQNLTVSPRLDTSNATDMRSMFYNCNKLNTISQLDTSKVTNINSMFCYCKMTTIPSIDTSNVTSMYQTFYSCEKLLEIPALNTSKVTTMYGLFSYCLNLITIPLLDTSNVSNIASAFMRCIKLTNLGGFRNLAVSLDLHDSTLLTVESLMNVVGNLKDLTGGTAQTLTLGATNLAKLTDEQKAVATNKNWVLA